MGRTITLLVAVPALLAVLAAACSDDGSGVDDRDAGGVEAEVGVEGDDLDSVESEGDENTAESGAEGSGSSAAVIDVVTGVGSFSLDIVSCTGFTDGPYEVTGDDGANTVEISGTATALDIFYTYASGDQITVDGTDLAIIDPAAGTIQFAGDATGPDGPELLVVEVDAC